jgi:uncharacterized membrane protein
MFRKLKDRLAAYWRGAAKLVTLYILFVSTAVDIYYFLGGVPIAVGVGMALANSVTKVSIVAVHARVWAAIDRRLASAESQS